MNKHSIAFVLCLSALSFAESVCAIPAVVAESPVDKRLCNSVSNTLSTVSNFYFASTNTSSDVSLRIDELDAKVEQSQKVEESINQVSEFYERSFAHLNGLITHAEWVLGIVFGLFGVVFPLLLQFNERQRSTAFMSEMGKELRHTQDRVDGIRGAVSKAMFGLRKDVAESVSNANEVVQKVKDQAVAAYQIAQDSRNAVEEQGKHTEEMTQLIKKFQKEMDALSCSKGTIE